MDRIAFNACMSPWIKGKGRTKDERKQRFCIGAKICSGKASNEEEAIQLCASTLPKWAKAAVKEEKQEENISCSDRTSRAKQNIEALALKVKVGEAEECKGLAATIMQDILVCHKDTEIGAKVKSAMDEFHSLSKGFYLNSEGKDFAKSMDEVVALLN